MLKPKAQTENEDGMLEFLEDIIGSSQFKEPIEELSKRVEELNEARGEKVCFSFCKLYQNNVLLGFVETQQCRVNTILPLAMYIPHSMTL